MESHVAIQHVEASLAILQACSLHNTFFGSGTKTSPEFPVPTKRAIDILLGVISAASLDSPYGEQQVLPRYPPP